MIVPTTMGFLPTSSHRITIVKVYWTVPIVWAVSSSTSNRTSLPDDCLCHAYWWWRWIVYDEAISIVMWLHFRPNQPMMLLMLSGRVLCVGLHHNDQCFKRLCYRFMHGSFTARICVIVLCGPRLIRAIVRNNENSVHQSGACGRLHVLAIVSASLIILVTHLTASLPTS